MKGLIIIVLVTIWSVHAFSQRPTATRQKITNASVPELLRLTFQEQYKDVLLIGWYVTHISYWYDDRFSSWYSDWYHTRNVVVYTFSQPAYYEVEFIDEPGQVSRAIYSRYGAWYETRTKLKALPRHIDEELRKSKYAKWTRSEHLEMMEIPGLHGVVYRLMLSNGSTDQIIRIDDQGHIVQIKEEKN